MRKRERARRGIQGWWILLNVVHRIDGFLRIVVIGVPNESEATAPTGVTVLNNHLDRWREFRLDSACASRVSRRRLRRSVRSRARAHNKKTISGTSLLYENHTNETRTARREENILLLRPDRTLRTSASEYPPPCATQGRCVMVSRCLDVIGGIRPVQECIWSYPINNLDMLSDDEKRCCLVWMTVSLRGTGLRCP